MGRGSGVHDLTSIDVENLSGDMTGMMRCQVGGHAGAVFRALPLAHWRDALDLVITPLRLGCLFLGVQS